MATIDECWVIVEALPDGSEKPVVAKPEGDYENRFAIPMVAYTAEQLEMLLPIARAIVAREVCSFKVVRFTRAEVVLNIGVGGW